MNDVLHTVNDETQAFFNQLMMAPASNEVYF